MRFVNVSPRGRYVSHCHRVVDRWGEFSAPAALLLRPGELRSVASSGAFACIPDPGEDCSGVSGFISLMASADEIASARASQEAPSASAASMRISSASEGAEAAREAAEALLAHAATASDIVNEPSRTEPYRTERVETQSVPTEADIIADDDSPVSLEAIRRHNAASRR